MLLQWPKCPCTHAFYLSEIGVCSHPCHPRQQESVVCCLCSISVCVMLMLFPLADCTYSLCEAMQCSPELKKNFTLGLTSASCFVFLAACVASSEENTGQEHQTAFAGLIGHCVDKGFQSEGDRGFFEGPSVPTTSWWLCRGTVLLTERIHGSCKASNNWSSPRRGCWRSHRTSNAPAECPVLTSTDTGCKLGSICQTKLIMQENFWQVFSGENFQHLHISPWQNCCSTVLIENRYI